MNFKAAALVSLPVLAVGICALWPSGPIELPVESPAVAQQEPLAEVPGPKAPAELPAPEAVELALAMERKSVAAEFSGNGRDKLKIIFMNKGTVPLKVQVPLGQMFESDSGSPLVVVQEATMVCDPGKTRELELRTAAISSTGQVAPSSYRISYATMPKLDALLRKVHEHPEIARTSLQTAVLAITENLPLSAVAKFPMAATGLPSRFNTDAFRVETHELMGALVLLREIGVREASIALTIDPQMKIEAMIDPATRAAAMRYYAISPDQEWEFWRRELLQGEPSTRHYALYGIARFYPEVALQMLPRWARETRTNPVYRLSAVQALADTQRPEASPLLAQLAIELGPLTELGKAAKGAGDYLDYQLAQLATTRNAVAFRTTRKTFDGAPESAVAKN